MEAMESNIVTGQSDMSISGELLLVTINLPMEECSSQPWQNQKIHGYLLISLSLSIYIEGPPSRMHFSYADAAPKAGPGGSAVWAQADWQPNAFSTTEL